MIDAIFNSFQRERESIMFVEQNELNQFAAERFRYVDAGLNKVHGCDAKSNVRNKSNKPNLNLLVIRVRRVVHIIRKLMKTFRTQSNEDWSPPISYSKTVSNIRSGYLNHRSRHSIPSS